MGRRHANMDLPKDERSGGSRSASAPRKQFLPKSAPVSSYLPPIPPSDCAFPSAAASIPGLLPRAAAPNTLSPAVQARLAAELLNAETFSATAANILTAANTPTTAVVNNQLDSNMHNWSLQQLEPEQHVNLLLQLKQPIPENVLLLLADARREEEKKKAKRVANRKAACASRARKKARVQEMAELNDQLFRQASILALLPDLVIVINVEAIITFCSEQVERVLGRKTSDLMGAKLTEILIPSSREKLLKLIPRLLEFEQRTEDPPKEEEDKKETKLGVGKDQDASIRWNAYRSGQGVSALEATTVVSFPSSVGKVGQAATRSNRGDAKTFSNERRIQKANANLERNVRWENARRPQEANANPERNLRWAGHKDDHIGSDDTANSATARLSSLQHQSSSSEDDSGYRESNDSREETSSFTSDFSFTNRRRPLAPTFNVCLIRHDMSTIWCEVTSSIQTRNLREECVDIFSEETKPKRASSTSTSATATVSKRSSVATTEGESPPTSADEETKEILLCLRPIRDVDEKPEKRLRLAQIGKELGKPAVSDDSNSGLSRGLASSWRNSS